MNAHTTDPTLTLQFDNCEQLYAAYMPFIEGGAIFAPTQQRHPLGDKVFLTLAILNEDFFSGEARVVWITPQGAQRGLRAGVGLQFVDESTRKLAESKLSTHLAGLLASDHVTETM